MTASNVCEDVIEEYLAQLSNNFEVVQSPNGCHLLTPFIRPDGEAIGLELTFLPNGNFSLDDMGDTLGYLYINGLTLTQAVLDRTKQIARSYDVSFSYYALAIEGDPSMIGDAVHNLVQTVLAVTSLIYGRRPNTRVLFDNEVESFIISVGVTYDFDYRVRGKQELHGFKFHVNSGRNLLVQPLSAATEAAAHSLAERWAYRFMDTVNNNAVWIPVAVLDDRNARQGVWTPEAQAPIRDNTVLWADKERLATMLTA